MSTQGDEDVSLWDRVKGYFDKERGTTLPNDEPEQGSGWQRVKSLFEIRETVSQREEFGQKSRWSRFKDLLKVSDDTGLTPEIEHIKTVVYATTAFAFLLGGRFGKRIIDDHFRRHNQLTVYDSAMHAQRQYHASVILGFIKYGCRWGWRAGAFAGVYSFLLVALEAFRNKHDAVNYVASGASTGVLYNTFNGWRKMVVGAAIGGGLSLPFGILAQATNAILPDEYKLNKLHQEQNASDDKEQEWKQNLKATSSFIESMEKDLDENVELKDEDR